MKENIKSVAKMKFVKRENMYRYLKAVTVSNISETYFVALKIKRKVI